MAYKLPILLIMLSGIGQKPAMATTLSSKPLTAIMQQHQVAAAAVIVVSREAVLTNLHLGVRDWESQHPFGPSDNYRIGSISKTFAGVLAMRLQHTKRLQLTDDINGYGLSPYLKNSHPNYPITLAHLLEHTAGLTDLNQSEWDYNQPDPINLQQAFELGLAEHQTHWPPVHSSYSNVGAGLFGLALEQKLNTRYEKLMQQQVFKPLGMQHSNLLLTAEMKQKLITGYDRDGKTPIPYWHNVYRPFAGINTNSADMVQWLQMWLESAGDDFLNQAARDRIMTPKTSLAAQQGLTYGYGLGLYQWQTKGHNFWGHGGDADGYLSRFGFNPETGLAYLVMINAFNKPALGQMVDRVEQHIIQGLPKPKYPKRLKLPLAQLKQYAGTYQSVTARFPGRAAGQLLLQIADGQLTYRLNQGPVRTLFAVTETQFRGVEHSTATLEFVQQPDGLYLQGFLGQLKRQ